MGFAVYRALPSSASVRRFLEAAFRGAGEIPRDLISDQGIQFTARAFRRWCHRHGIRHRFGALGKYGSLAVIERGIRTFKNECTRRLSVVPFRLAVLEQELVHMSPLTTIYMHQSDQTLLGAERSPESRSRCCNGLEYPRVRSSPVPLPSMVGLRTEVVPGSRRAMRKHPKTVVPRELGRSRGQD